MGSLKSILRTLANYKRDLARLHRLQDAAGGKGGEVSPDALRDRLALLEAIAERAHAFMVDETAPTKDWAPDVFDAIPPMRDALQDLLIFDYESRAKESFTCTLCGRLTTVPAKFRTCCTCGNADWDTATTESEG